MSEEVKPHMVKQTITYSDGTETVVNYRGVVKDGVLTPDKVEDEDKELEEKEEEKASEPEEKKEEEATEFEAKPSEPVSE